MDHYYPFPSIGDDRRIGAGDIAALLSTFFTTGVSPAPANSLQVVAAGGMKVRIQPGACCILGRVGRNDVAKELTLAVADGVLSRIDRIVLRCDFTNRMIVEAVKQGVPASTPSPPALRRDSTMYEIALADVTVARSAREITQAVIADKRPWPDLCGWLGLIDGKDTGGLFIQWEDAFRRLYEAHLANVEADADTYERWFDRLRGSLLETDLGQFILQLAGTVYVASRAVYTVVATGWTYNAAKGRYEYAIANADITADCDVFAGVQGEMRGRVSLENYGDVLNGGVRLISLRAPTVDFDVQVVVMKQAAGVPQSAFVHIGAGEPERPADLWLDTDG